MKRYAIGFTATALVAFGVSERANAQCAEWVNGSTCPSTDGGIGSYNIQCNDNGTGCVNYTNLPSSGGGQGVSTITNGGWGVYAIDNGVGTALGGLNKQTSSNELCGSNPSPPSVGGNGGAIDCSGVYGTSTWGNGVYGTSTNLNGVSGYNTGSYSTGSGVFGYSVNGVGVWANSSYGYGLYASSPNNHGIYALASGSSTYGVSANATGEYGTGIYASTTGQYGYGYGVYGINTNSSPAGGTGIYGTAATTGVEGLATGSTGTGVLGYGDQSGVAGACYVDGCNGVYGSTTSNANGVQGTTSGTWSGVGGANTYTGSCSGVECVGVYGQSANGIGVYGGSAGSTANAIGVYGYSADGNWAGYFHGNAEVTGTFYNPSDIRLKEKVQPLEGAIDKLLLLKGVTFEWKILGSTGSRPVRSMVSSPSK